MFHDPMDLATEKAAARTEALARRAKCDPALAANLVKTFFASRWAPAPGTIFAGFWPLEGEIDIRPLLTALAGRGVRLCLPVTPKRGEPLTFRSWEPGAPLTEGHFKTMHPAASIETIPDIILTPLLAFDSAGNRLGYGAGYYDRTFAAHPTALRLGCAFSSQRLDHVPHGPHDIKLHAIATELGVYAFRRSN